MTRPHALIEVHRIYEPPNPDDGYRVLVDGIWPRGLTKAAAALDEWCRDIAPSAALRRWYRHDPNRFLTFRDRYLTELREPVRAGALARFRARSDMRQTLLTATRDLDLSHARVLAEFLSASRG